MALIITTSINQEVMRAPASSMTSSSCFSLSRLYIFCAGNDGQSWRISLRRQLLTFSLNRSPWRTFCDGTWKPKQIQVNKTLHINNKRLMVHNTNTLENMKT